MTVEPIEPVPPTQVVHPWRATFRTVLATVVGGLIALSALWPVLEPVFRDTVDQFPPYLARVVLPVLGSVGVLAGLVTRLMAIPAVNAWLTKWRAGASPTNPVHKT